MSEYWIPQAAGGGANRRLHTDEDCQYLQAAKSYTDTTRADHPDKPICTRCQGVQPTGGSGGSRAHLKSLEDASPDTITPRRWDTDDADDAEVAND